MSGSRNIKDATTNIFLINPTSESSWNYQIDDEHLEIDLYLSIVSFLLLGKPCQSKRPCDLAHMASKSLQRSTPI